MTQADRDRLVTLKKAKKKLITQAEAAAELQVSVRHVKRMLKALSASGDKSVVHGLRGRESNRKIERKIQDKAVKILSADSYRGFGPTLASEHLAKKHGIAVSRETLRKWMQAAVYGRADGGGQRTCICGGSGGAGAANWCSGTPAITTGWKGAAASGCT